MKSPNGLLLVDKPTDWTSFDVVNKIRGIISRELDVKPKKIKVGHSGTLDPIATGLLILAIGPATKEMHKFTKLDKTYITKATLGFSSDTGDSTGVIEREHVLSEPSPLRVKKVLDNFIGTTLQTPHKYSAIKVNGVRAYKLAREGIAVKIKPRKVKIHQIDELIYDWPVLSFTARVSSGTYIRSLIEDIGGQLNTGAYMDYLRRTEIGDFSVSEAIQMKELSFEKIMTSMITP